MQAQTRLGVCVALIALAGACEPAPENGPATTDVGPAAARASAAPEAKPAPAVRARLGGDVVDYHGRPLPGAMVTARDAVHARSVSVFTDGNGAYRFPDLDLGEWTLRVAIAGFERRARTVQLDARGLDVDFQLRLADAPHEQLPASHYYARIEWPEARQRANFALACGNCHQIGDVLWRRPRSAADWEAVIARMEFRGPPLFPETREQLVPAMMAAFGSYAADDFGPVAPPSGAATRAVIWEYDVDPQGRNDCHDLEIAEDGSVYTENGFAFHPETLERHHHEVPRGAHSIERAPDGMMWITVTGSDLMTRLDPDTGEMKSLPHPEIGDDQGVYPHTLRFDAKGDIWYTLTVSNHVARLDPRSEEFTYYDLPRPDEVHAATRIPIAYGLDVAPDQRLWWSQLLVDRIGVLDPESGEIRSWKTPVEGPRRLRVGPDGMVWVPGYASGDLARFDPRTEEWKVYELPTRPAGTELPYALNVNHRTGDVWVAGSNSDTLIRFEPDREVFTVYPLPTPVAFTREIEFDDAGHVWTCMPDRGTGPEGPLSGRFLKLELLEREGRCGDGALQLGEQCDDGNTSSGDGCSAACALEGTVAWEG